MIGQFLFLSLWKIRCRIGQSLIMHLVTELRRGICVYVSVWVFSCVCVCTGVSRAGCDSLRSGQSRETLVASSVIILCIQCFHFMSSSCFVPYSVNCLMKRPNWSRHLSSDAHGVSFHSYQSGYWVYIHVQKTALVHVGRCVWRWGDDI